VLKSLLSGGLTLSQGKLPQSKSQDKKNLQSASRMRKDEFIQQVYSQIKTDFKIFRRKDNEKNKVECLATQSQVSTFRKPLALRLKEKRRPGSPVNTPPSEQVYFVPASIQTDYLHTTSQRKEKKITELSKSAEKSFRINSDSRVGTASKEKTPFLNGEKKSRSIRAVQKLSTQGTQHFSTSPQTFPRVPANQQLDRTDQLRSEPIQLFPKKRPRGGSFSGPVQAGPTSLFLQKNEASDRPASASKDKLSDLSSLKKPKLIDFGADLTLQKPRPNESLRGLEVLPLDSETSLAKQRKRYSVEVPTIQSTLIYDHMKDPSPQHSLKLARADSPSSKHASGAPQALPAHQPPPPDAAQQPVVAQAETASPDPAASTQPNRRTSLKRATSIEKTINSTDHITEGTGSSPVNLQNRQSLNTAKKTSEIGLTPEELQDPSAEELPATSLSKPTLIVLPIENFDSLSPRQSAPPLNKKKNPKDSPLNFQDLLTPVRQASRFNPNDQSIIDDPDFPPEAQEDKLWQSPTDRVVSADEGLPVEPFPSADQSQANPNNLSFHHVAPVRSAEEKEHLLSIIDALIKQNLELHLKLGRSKAEPKNTILSNSIFLGETSFQKQPDILDRHNTTVYPNRILQREDLRDAESFAMAGPNQSISMNHHSELMLEEDHSSPRLQPITKTATFLSSNRSNQPTKPPPPKPATSKQSLFAIKAQEAKEAVSSSKHFTHRKQSTSEANLHLLRDSSPLGTASAANLTPHTTPTDNSSRIK